MLGVGAAAGILVMHFGMLKYVRVPLSVFLWPRGVAAVQARYAGHDDGATDGRLCQIEPTLKAR